MRLIRFQNPTHTTKQAAKELGCDVNQIIKTLIFHDKEYYFIAIVPGDAKLNYSKVKKLLNIARPSMASPDKVLEISGSPIGGVKPIFRTNLKVILDEKIMQYDNVYGGGGDANTIMEISPREIVGEMNPIIWNIAE
jgi:prolyl-tRNA editing enzyme YbaK/EbsC (Cys-tRNA(Pro) deacylase)